MKKLKSNRSLLQQLASVMKINSISEMICLVLCIFVLVSLVIYIFAGMPARLTSDSANHAVLAEEMLYTGQFIPGDWNSRMDIYILGPHNVMALLTLFSDNQVLMLSITCFLHLLTAVAVFVYFSDVVSKNRCWLLFTPLLLCGVSEDFLRIVFDQISYIVPMIFIFLVTALYVDSLDNGQRIKSKIKFILCLLLLLLLTAQGVRYLQAIVVPLIAAIVLLFLYENSNDILADVVRTRDFRFAVFHAAVIMVIAVMGIVLFKLCGQAHNFLPTKDLSAFSSDFGETLLNFWDKFVGLLGIEQGCSLFSTRGILNLIKLFGGIMLLIVLPVLQIRKFDGENHNMRFFTVFTCVHVLEILILSIFCNALDAIRYLYTSMFLLYYLSAHYLIKYVFTNKVTVKSMVAVLCACMFVLPISLPKALSFRTGREEFENVTALPEYLKEQGLTYGYGTTWNSVVNTIYSDFQVRINKAGLSPVEPIRRNNTDRAYFEETYQGRSFILTKGEKEREKYLSSDSYQLFGEPARIDRFGEYDIFIYDYNVANNDFGGIEGGFSPEESTRLFVIKNELDAKGLVLYQKESGCLLISSDTAYQKAQEGDKILIVSDVDELPFAGINAIEDENVPNGYFLYIAEKATIETGKIPAT